MIVSIILQGNVVVVARKEKNKIAQCVVVSTAASQQVNQEFKSSLGGIWLFPAWVLSEYSCFLPQSKNMQGLR